MEDSGTESDSSDSEGTPNTDNESERDNDLNSETSSSANSDDSETSDEYTNTSTSPPLRDFRDTVKPHEYTNIRFTFQNFRYSFDCVVCSSSFNDLDLILQHLRTHKLSPTPLPQLLTDDDICSLSHLSPTQQRLSLALLHTPQLTCPIPNCYDKFVLKDQLASHSTFHGQFSCNLCSHTESFAPYFITHILDKHCTPRCKGPREYVVNCTACSLEIPLGHHLFHYLNKHLGLSALSLGCPLCSTTVSYSSLHSHFHAFHDVFSIPRKDIQQCDHCPAFFSSEEKLFNHRITVHNVTYGCPDCLKSYAIYRDFDEHRPRCKIIKMKKLKKIEDEVDKAKNTIESHGPKGTNSSEDICANLKLRYKSKKYLFQCTKCSKSFRQLKVFSTHQYVCRSTCSTSKQKIPEVGIFSRLSPTQQQLSLATLHTPQFPCTVASCSETFAYEHHLQTHSKLHGTFSCQMCSQVKTFAPTLATHVATEHCVSTKPDHIQCPLCPLEIPAKHFIFHYLNIHLKLPVSSLGCLICHCFPTNCHTHFKRVHHAPFQSPIHLCDLCPAFFTTNWMLSEHRQIFHGESSFTCATCKHNLHNQKSLRKHLTDCKPRPTRRHLPFACKYPGCDKRFGKIGYLKLHKIHCSMKSTCRRGCVYTPKRQRNYWDLSKFKWAGTVEDFKCEECGKSFACKSSLSMHELIHLDVISNQS